MTDSVCPHDERIVKIEETSASNSVKLDSVLAQQENFKKDFQDFLDLKANVTSVAGFLRKHGGKILSFGAGVMSILGIGNPKLIHFITTFSWN